MGFCHVVNVNLGVMVMLGAPSRGFVLPSRSVITKYHSSRFTVVDTAVFQFPSTGSDPSVTSLLDGEQEKTTASRAYEEEDILINSPSPREVLTMPSEEERKKATKWIKKILRAETRGKSVSGGGGGGFGGKKTKKPKKSAGASPIFDPSLDPHGFGSVLQKRGVTRIDDALSPTTARSLVTYIDRLKLQSEDEVARGDAPALSRFSRVLLKSNRWDVLLPFDHDNHPLISQALYELLAVGTTTTTPISSVIESTLGPDAELYELACLISDPGSDRQVIHPDIAHRGSEQVRTGPLLTCFVALQDVTEAMGPTEFLPGTNTKECHDLCNDRSRRDDLLRGVESRLSLLKEGDCSVFDATTLHAGTANRSEVRRRLFYFTFRSRMLSDPRSWNNPGSIRPELKERKLTLAAIKTELERWHNSKELENEEQ